jgi:hypothetical protein
MEQNGAMPIMISKASEEQRGNRRLFKELKVGVAVLSRYPVFFFWRPQFHAKTRNVSATGLELLADRPLPAGTTLKLWLQVPIGGELQVLKLRGTVVATSPAEATGAFLCHIRLHDRPSEFMQIWANTIFEMLRNREG